MAEEQPGARHRRFRSAQADPGAKQLQLAVHRSGGATFTDSGTAATHRAASPPPPAQTGPAAPTGLAASASTTGIGLTWSSTEPSSTGFTVARGTSAAGPFTALTTTPVTGRSYFDASTTNSPPPASQEVIDRVALATGATGTWSVTASAPGVSIAQTIALRPA